MRTITPGEEQFTNDITPPEHRLLSLGTLLSSPTNRMDIAIGDDWFDWKQGKIPRSEKYDRIEAVIGDTPIRQVTDLGNDSSGRILTKFESANPSGSHYDRAFLKTLRYLEENDLIEPGDELRDITSGSAGISLATLGWALDYKVRITVPDELPDSRLFPMRSHNAEVVNAGPGYIKRASEFQAEEIQAFKADPEWELVRPADRNQRALIFRKGDKRICYLNHSENLLTPDAFRAIGEEAVSQLVEAPDAVLLAMGTWTTIAGVSPVIRKAWPAVRIIGYEGENTTNHDNYGTTVSGIPMRFHDPSLIDDKVVVTNKQRGHYDQLINHRPPYQLQLGHSSVMGLAAAHDAIQRQGGGTALTIAYDDKHRY